MSEIIIGDYILLKRICRHSYPCQHDVQHKITKKRSRMSGDKIYTMLKEQGISNPHFDQYAEYIRKRDHPTQEELLKYQEENRINQIKHEEWVKILEEQQQLTNQYKASSYLEKLKAKNNIHKVIEKETL